MNWKSVSLSVLLATAAPFTQAVVAQPVAAPAPAPAPAPPPPQFAYYFQAGGGSHLGISTVEVDAERAKALNLKEVRGVEVSRVEDDSPASKGGMKSGDVVLEFNGQRVEGTEMFVRLVRETPAGREVKMVVSRAGAPQTLTVTTGSRRKVATMGWSQAEQEKFHREMEKVGKDMEKLRIELPRIHVNVDIPRPVMNWRSGTLGIDAETLEGQLADYFGVKEGVLVRAVAKDTPAEKAGIKAGDIITKLDGQSVTSPRQVTSAIRAMKAKKAFPVVVLRNKAEMSLNVTLDEDKAEERVRVRGRTVSDPKEY